MFEEFFGRWQSQLIYILRILFAGICGFILGLERRKRHKEAGIRTHFVVSAGSALIMCVSMSFTDDTARIAAQIVSGIGFLGAGMIVFRKQSLYGLTTSAGIWATAGIGMAFGAGLYILGLSATLVIVFAMIILHSSRFDKNYVPNSYLLLIKLYDDGVTLQKIKELFGINTFYKYKIYKENDAVKYEVVIKTEQVFKAEFLSEIMKINSAVYSIERIEEN